MIKVSPYINTIGCEKYKEFINNPFSVTMLFSFKENDIIKYFDGWKGEYINDWYILTNQDYIVLEFHPTLYNIIYPKTGNKFSMPLPITINDFINDMHSVNVQLYWSDIIDEMFEPKEYLDKDEIREYFERLLTIMEKSYELL